MNIYAEKYIDAEYKLIDRLSEDGSTSLMIKKGTGETYVKKYVDGDVLLLYKLIKSLNIDGTPKIEEIFHTDEGGIVIYEFINGLSLERKIERDGVMKIADAKRYMDELCRIVGELHKSNIIHRDITASNVIISGDRCYLIDFGIAREKKPGKNSDTRLLGTVGYAAPEQFGFSQTDEKTDIYALGVIFNYMLTGELPGKATYRGRESAIIKKCIQIDGSKRYKSVDQLRRAIKYRKNDAFRKSAVVISIIISVAFMTLHLSFMYQVVRYSEEEAARAGTGTADGADSAKDAGVSRIDSGAPADDDPENAVGSETQAPQAANASGAGEAMTLELYNKLDTGMSYDEAVEIMGREANADSNYEMFGSVYRTCSWTGTPGSFASVSVTFIDDKLSSKSQVGLK